MAQGSVRYLGREDGDFSQPASHGGVNSFRLFVLFTPPPNYLTLATENFTAIPWKDPDRINDDLNFTPIVSDIEQDSTNEGIVSFSLTPNGMGGIQMGIRVDGITDKNGNGYKASTSQFRIRYKPPPGGLGGLVAQAGNSRTVASGTKNVQLDGNGSTKSGGGRTVKYAWTQTGGTGSAVTLSDMTILRPTFDAQTLTAGADSVTYIFTLTVTDDQGSTAATDMVTITVTAPAANMAPVADAGAAQRLVTGGLVTLDGSRSRDPDGTRVTYSWMRATGADRGTGDPVTLSDLTAAQPTFTAVTPDAGADDETYGFTLTVTDDDGATDEDMVTITVNAPPKADAGDRQEVASGALVTLNGSGSSDSTGPYTYAWMRSLAPNRGNAGTVTLNRTNPERPTFTPIPLDPGAPDATYGFTLTVTDDDGATDEDMVTITVTSGLVAQAGPDQDNVGSGAPVTLDGRGSTGSDTKRKVTYSWARTGGTTGGTVTLTDPNTLAPSFTADTLNPGDADVEHIITLTVTDNQGTAAATDTVTITVKAPAFGNLVAQAGPDQDNVGSGTKVTLDGSGSTPTGSGRDVTYSWARTGGTAGGTVTLTDATTLAPSFTADTLNPGDADVEHIITLTVMDDQGSTDATDTVMVTVTAVMVDILVNPPDLTVQEGGSGTYQVSLSESPRRVVSVIAFPDHEDVVLDNVRLMFNAENWDTWQDVRIITVADADKEDDIARIRHRLVANGVALGQAGIVTVRVRDEDPILRPIGNYLASRATALLNNQPDLIRFLKQDEITQGGNFTLKATEGRLVMNGGFVHDGVWGEVTGSYGNSDSGDTKSVLGSFAFHRKYSENLLVGAMLQFDLSDHDSDHNLARNNGRIDGIGWLVGPYFVARHWSQPLYFEGRLFYGDSGNDIGFIDRDLGVRTGSFDTTRLLAQIRVEGEIALSDLDEGLRLIPYADARWIEDRAEAFTDRIGNRFVNRVPGQKVSTGQLELGSNVEIPVVVNHGEMTLIGGLGLVYANTEGDYITSDSRGRGRGEIGFSYGLDNNVWIDFESFYDGIGSSRYESYGLSLSAEMKF